MKNASYSAEKYRKRKERIRKQKEEDSKVGSVINYMRHMYDKWRASNHGMKSNNYKLKTDKISDELKECSWKPKTNSKMNLNKNYKYNKRSSGVIQKKQDENSQL